MSYLIKDGIHGVFVDAIYNEIFSKRANYYYFIGKVIPWDVPTVPDAPINTQSYEYDTRNNIISVKKIQLSDISYVIPRRNWVSGIVYDQFDGDYSTSYPSNSGATSLKTSTFYVLTAEFNVYKCIFNNRNSPSTIEPSGTDPITITTGDGYVWKYMYTIPLSIRNRFLTETLMPVQKAVYNSFYSNGEIDRVIVDSYGSGYYGNLEVTLQVDGVFKGGSGNVVANLIPVINQQGSITAVKIKNAGNNYLTANIIVVDNKNTGNSYYGIGNSAILTAVIYEGKIDRVLVADPGIGYSSNIQTVFSLIGDGTGAAFTPYINEAGQLEDVIIESRGQGYTYLDVEVVGDGANANVQPFISTGDLDTLQSTVELAAAEGAIHAIRILNQGNGYTSANIVLTGDGSGFAGTVVLSNANTVSYINVTNPGSGYTYANVTITGNGTNAVATAILSPSGGHGSNAVKELFADTIMFYSTINNETIHGLNVDNDYRQFGIIRNPKQFNNDRLFANVTGTPCILLAANTVINSLSNTLQQDTILELANDSTRKYEVVDVDEVNSRILINPLNNKYLNTGNVLYDPITDSNFPILTVNSNPTINKFSGELLFIDNRTKVSYSDQQLVTLKTTIKL